MPESLKRIIVDGIEFGQVFQFPRILRAVLSSLQLSRLAIALLMVTAIMTVGRVWDNITTHTVHPSGLSALEGSTYDARSLQQALHGGMTAFAPDRFPQGSPELESRWVMRTMREGYLQKRVTLTTVEEQARLDRAYRSNIDYIEAARPKGAFEATVNHLQVNFRQAMQSLLQWRFVDAFDASIDMLCTPWLLLKNQPWFAIFFGVFFVLVWSVGGGAISRIAAVQFAGEGERLSLRRGIDYAMSRWMTLLGAQLLPIIIVGIVLALLAVVGLLMRVPVLDVIAALFYGLLLLLGMLIAFLLIGYVLGAPLIVPSVACESNDAADAVQRSYSYVVGKPLHLLGYWLMAKVGCILGYLLIAAFALLTLNITAAAFAWWAGEAPALAMAGGYRDLFDLSHPRFIALPDWHSVWAANLIAFWQMVIVSLVVAYLVSYHFSVSTIVYLLIRRACDGQTTDDIWREQSEDDLAAAAATKPVLETKNPPDIAD